MQGTCPLLCFCNLKKKKKNIIVYNQSILQIIKNKSKPNGSKSFIIIIIHLDLYSSLKPTLYGSLKIQPVSSISNPNLIFFGN